MRTRNSSARGLTVQAVAGTYVVLLGFDLAPQDRTGLLGFAVQRSDLTGDIWLSGGITFPTMTAGPNGEQGTNIFPSRSFAGQTSRLNQALVTPTSCKPCTG